MRSKQQNEFDVKACQHLKFSKYSRVQIMVSLWQGRITIEKLL